jgi:hypothetical protein
MKEIILEQIPIEGLIPDRWYVGRGRNRDVAKWDGIDSFVTICSKFGMWVTKYEGYYDPERGCFQPFYLIDDIIEQTEEQTQKGKVELVDFRFYRGKQPTEVALWTGKELLTIDDENRYVLVATFEPIMQVDTCETLESVGKSAWDNHYAKKLMMRVR